MNDLRFAFRQLVRRPAFSLTAIFALALGIGATTAIFGVIYGFLLRPLPFAQPEQLVMLQSQSTRSGSDLGVNYLDFQDWKTEARSFAHLAFFNLRWNGNLETNDGRTETLKTTFTTANLFHLLGVKPFLGRDLVEADDAADAPKVMMISHRLWAALGSDRQIIGRELRLDGSLHQIIGVMPEGFRFPVQSDLWVPMASVFAKGTDRSWRADQAVARLRPGVSLAEANAEMRVIAERLGRQYPQTNADVSARAIGLREHWTGELRSPLFILLVACGGVLAMACANVSQLLLARTAARESELAVRAALGASRRRLVRQLLTESALLGLLGCLLGGVLAFWLVDFVRVAVPIELPFWVTIEVNGGALLFAAAISLLTGLLAGSLPAWQATRLEFSPVLRQTRASHAGNRTRELLTAAQVCISIILLAGASMILRSVLKLQATDPGFDPRQTLLMEVNPTYKSEESAQLRLDRFTHLLTRIGELPGVEMVAANNSPPFVAQRPWNRAEVTAEGQSSDAQKENPRANYQTVSPQYFSLLHIPLLAGRFFEERDDRSAPRVCMVSARLAARLWPNEQAIDRRLHRGGPDEEKPEWMNVVGVVGDVRHQALAAEPGPDLYECSQQLAWKQMHFLVRARAGLDPQSLIPAIRAQVAATAPGTGVFNFTALEKEVRDSLWQPRLQSWLLGFFSLVALTLAVAGLYGALAYCVAQRTLEIGIRMALGATRGGVVRLIIGHGMRAVLLGLVLGIGGAFVFSRLLRASFFGAGEGDPFNYLIASALLLFAASGACWWPARRATRVEPSEALRAE